MAKSGQSHWENVALVAIAVVIYHVQRGALVAMNALDPFDTSAVKSNVPRKRLGLEKWTFRQFACSWLWHQIGALKLLRIPVYPDCIPTKWYKTVEKNIFWTDPPSHLLVPARHHGAAGQTLAPVPGSGIAHCRMVVMLGGLETRSWYWANHPIGNTVRYSWLI